MNLACFSMYCMVRALRTFLSVTEMCLKSLNIAQQCLGQTLHGCGSTPYVSSIWAFCRKFRSDVSGVCPLRESNNATGHSKGHLWVRHFQECLTLFFTLALDEQKQRRYGMIFKSTYLTMYSIRTAAVLTRWWGGNKPLVGSRVSRCLLFFFHSIKTRLNGLLFFNVCLSFDFLDNCSSKTLHSWPCTSSGPR